MRIIFLISLSAPPLLVLSPTKNVGQVVSALFSKQRLSMSLSGAEDVAPILLIDIIN